MIPMTMTMHFDARGEVDIAPPDDFTVTPGPLLASEVRDLLGYGAVQFLRKPARIEPANNGGPFRRT